MTSASARVAPIPTKEIALEFVTSFFQQRACDGGIDRARIANMAVAQKRETVVRTGVRAHSARIGSGIAFLGPFVVLHHNHINHVRAVAKGLKAEFLTI